MILSNKIWFLSMFGARIGVSATRAGPLAENLEELTPVDSSTVELSTGGYFSQFPRVCKLSG
jgi:hypothetical protein